MRIHIKEQVKQKINSNWLTKQNIPSQHVNYPCNFSRAPKNNSNVHTQECIINEKNSAKDIIKKLIVQNSELRKLIYNHEHTISTLKVQMLNREVETKNIMREYRQMIEGLLENMNLEGVDLKSKSSLKESWQQRRSKLYEKYDSQKSFTCSIQYNCIDQSMSSKNSQSRRNKSCYSQQKSSKFNEQLYQIQNPQYNSIPKLHFKNNSFEKSQKSFSKQKSQFQMSQGENLNNYEIIDYQKQYKQTQMQQDLNLRLNSLSSVTDIYQPNIQTYLDNKVSQIFPTVKLENYPTTAYNSNAETERISRNTDKKKSTGRMSSQGAVSQSPSFQKILEKGVKNRERINRLLNNFTKNDEKFL